MNKHLIILGSGPGGYSAALIAAQKGLNVTLIEKRDIGGTCLNRGCIPTKALLTSSEVFSKIKDAGKYGIRIEKAFPDIEAIQARKDKIVKTLRSNVEGLLKKRGVKIISGSGRFIDVNKIEAAGEILTGDYFIIATGTEAMRLFKGESILTSDEALESKIIPATLLVIGAGAVGLELACFYSEIGSKVTVVEMLPQILPGMDTEIAEILAREMKKKGIQIKTNCRIENIVNNEVFLADGNSIKSDMILQATGRIFNTEEIGVEKTGLNLEKKRIKTDETMKTEINNIYAIGDIVSGSPLLAHSASMQGIIAALNIAGENIKMNYDAIPNCVYTHPEVSSAGFKEHELENPLISKIPYRAMGKAHATGDLSGMIKIVADRKTRKIKGIHIAGEKATEILHEGVLAIRMGLKIDELAEITRAHPTYSEIYSEALHLLMGNALHHIS